MFDSSTSGVGLSEDFLSSGESHDDIADHDVAYLTTCLEMADGWEDPDRHVLPSDLEAIPVGLHLMAVVASVDRTKLNGHDAIRLLQAEDRLVSSRQAARLATMAEVAHCPPGDVNSPVERSTSEIEYAAVEIAAALTLTRRAAERELDIALSLRDRLLRVWRRFAQGGIAFRKVGEFVRQLGHLDRQTIDEVLDNTLEHASELTSGQLRARIARTLMEEDPEGAASGFQEGLGERRVVTHSNPDFTGNLSIQSADPIEIQRARTHIEELARSLKTHGEERDIDQIRADVALGLLQGHCHCGSKVRGSGGVHLVADVATLAELADTPGELAGYGPVIAEITRKAALSEVDGSWTYTLTDGDRPVSTGPVRRRPSTRQRRAIRAAYGTCAFVGCRMPSFDCDLDHRRPYSRGGPTQNDNLAPLCRHHHMTRHHVPWLLERRPDGDHTWTSPLGHTYVSKRGPPD